MMAMVGFLAKGQKSFTVRWSMMHLKENLKSCELQSSSGLLTKIAFVWWKLVCNCNCIAGATGWITRKVQRVMEWLFKSFRKVEKCCFTDPDPKSGVQWVGKGIVVSKITSQVSGFGFDLSNLLVSSWEFTILVVSTLWVADVAQWFSTHLGSKTYEVVGLIPARCWDFFFFSLFYLLITYL